MTKTYLSAFRRLILTKPNGDTVIFEDRSYGDFGSIYTTDKKDDQKFIESQSMYGDQITLLLVAESQETISDSESEELIDYPEITKVQEAIAILKTLCTERGIDCEVIRSRDKVISKAKELGIQFSNLK